MRHLQQRPTHLRAKHRAFYTYADGGVLRGPWEIHSDKMCLLNPLLVFEVLSRSTRDYDSGAKREDYQQISSLRYLLLIDQPTRIVRHDWRSSNGDWQTREFNDEVITLPELGGILSL